MKAVTFVDGTGRPVSLGKQLGTGGEGTVYEVAGHGDLVAKVYHKRPHADHAEKLRAMVGMAKKELCGIAAWPMALLSERPNGPVVGLTMKKVKDFKEAHTLYSPAQRKVTFPQADWKFLAHVAANCAAAFHIVHAQDIVVGDVNQSNLLVNRDGYVNFIDCDSCQVQTGGRTYPCEVGVPLFTPPELIGRSFRGLIRTANHDRFGLAVLVFHLLMMGRHPFSGRYSGTGEMPIERAIQESRFAYGGTAASVQMQPPLHALALSAVTPQLGTLFEKAFGSQSPVTGRPTAGEWHQALTGFRDSLRQCPRDSGHQTPIHVSGCVWCDLIKQGAPNFFVSVAFAAAVGANPSPAFVLVTVWGRINAVPRPTLGYTRPTRVAVVAPTPWPTSVLSVVPPKPVTPVMPPDPGLPPSPVTRAIQTTPRLPPRPSAPAILTKPHVPPKPVLPPRRFLKYVVPYSTSQRVTLYVVLALIAFLLPCCLLGPALVQALTGRQQLSGRDILGIEAVFILAAVTWWVVLEWKRRCEQVANNMEYEEEERERRQLVRLQLDAWKRKNNADVTAAQRQYDAEVQKWEQSALAIRQEADRRRADIQRQYDAEVRGWEQRIASIRQEAERRRADIQRQHDAEVQKWEQRVSAVRQEAERRRSAAHAAAQAITSAESGWVARSAAWYSEFDRKKGELSALRDSHNQLGQRLVAERQQLLMRAQEFQRVGYLQQQFIDAATIPDIGPTRKATLASFGIESAYDLTEGEILAIPGFGEKLTERLLDWRAGVESQFRFDPAVGVPEHERQALEFRYFQQRQPVEARLADGERELIEIARRARTEFEDFARKMQPLVLVMERTTADLAVIPTGI